MRILDIIQESTKPNLRLIRGKWSWVLPDTSVVGSFDSQQAAIDAARKDPSMLQPKVTPADTSGGDKNAPAEKNKPGQNEPSQQPTEKKQKKNKGKRQKDLPFDANAGKQPTTKPQGLESMFDRWKTRHADYAAYLDETVPKWVNRLSVFTRWLLKYIGLFEPVYQLYEQLAKAEKDYIDEVYPFNAYEQYNKKGMDISEEQADEVDKERYSTARNWILGEFMAKEGAIIVTRSIVMVVKFVLWTKMIKNVFLWIGAPVTFYTSAAAAVSTEVLILIFIKWLESPDGRKYWEDRFRREIMFVGTAGDSMWQAFNAFYSTATQGKIVLSKDEVNDARKKLRDQGGGDSTNDKNPPNQPTNTPSTDKNDKNKTTDNQRNKGQGTQDDSKTVPSKKLPKQPPVEQTKTKYPDFIRIWSNGGWYVGGHPVTDGDGFLEPGVDQVGTVDGARRWAISRGYPDPLADLPTRPGQKRPEPIGP